MVKAKTLGVVAVLFGAGAAGFWAANSIEEEGLSPLAQHMHEHLDGITAIKALLIAGRLEEAREPARWLAEHEQADGMSPDWQPFVDRMRLNARAVVDADSLGSAAISVAEMARACGDCHLASGFTIAFGFDEKPDVKREDLSADMLRHMWASDRMWEGLIGPSDVSWQRGTDALLELTLESAEIESMAAGAENQEDMELTAADLLSHVRRLGGIGARSDNRAERSALYGDFLSRCAECHVLTGGGPELY